MSKKEEPSRKWRVFRHAFLLSAGLNVVLAGLFFYFFIWQASFPIFFAYPPAELSTAPVVLPLQALKELLPLSSEELKNHLTDLRKVEEGYKVRDLALALLVYRERIDLKRALGKSPAERKWQVANAADLSLFPGLKDDDFQKFFHFIEHEKHPQDAERLHHLMTNEACREESLLQTFMRTEEYLQLSSLFAKASVPLTKGALLALAGEMPWPLLSSFVEEQKSGAI